MSSDLATTYLGMQLDSPVIVGACHLTIEPETVRQMVFAGAGAVVMPSMMQEQIVYQNLLDVDPDTAAQRSGYQPQQDNYNGGPTVYLDTIRELKAHTKVPIIGSLNGTSVGEWMSFATLIEAAGADAIELNFQPRISDPKQSAESIESEMCDMAHKVCESVTIPVAVKMSRRLTNLASCAHRIKNNGAQGVILFAHQPRWDIDIDRMQWTVRWELTPDDWISRTLEGIVRARSGGLGISIAASGGIRTSEDAIKAIIAGADVVMVTSEIFREGPDVIRKILSGLEQFMATKSYGSLKEFKQSRIPVETEASHWRQLEYLEPLTLSKQFVDRTPGMVHDTGDSFGHRL
ncbi:dihydroorotate dehydrogenase-like protein [Novipirellula artificiosorum]|uniref:NAD-dependent dihydropyrimidine dehydrogenase subunit PreA n=1 Tax=Novipirellula artificiosorum TaxID=2528016 RepID=A0A5C6D0A6_9BACT|nr:dihydroorotate dehydrogenase-like protein [Novipirellula artificiosorum]TWU30563.1 NAD-dependent dihydropyrimidine dehydrogenase subunit PreA [Novipirellula artificiosorum]